ncbi:uncharacterized protein LOC114410461 isoform X1 [Glycine soja]|nr:uncharacterized protein LOC114410461 isoform X1 [Glycine soja]RZC18322.1 hypothetical protein D0Y65_010794 [Glycine soja]
MKKSRFSIIVVKIGIKIVKSNDFTILIALRLKKLTCPTAGRLLTPRRYGVGSFMQPYLCICKEVVFGFEPMTNSHQGATFPLCEGTPSIQRFKSYVKSLLSFRFSLLMAKVGKLRSKARGHRPSPHLLSCERKNLKDVNVRKSSSKALEKKDWEDATCSVCMEVPHNAILLLCSSYDKGCRPYMCATSHRYSNCFEQYKKAYTKATSVQSLQLEANNSNIDLSTGEPKDDTEVPELLCPLCRRQVKGWTVVEVARKCLNAKKRSCMQDDCSFVGNYKELRKHVRSKHPFARPREVDPLKEEKWKRFECERERNDVISTILSSTPGAMVLGDYVLEPNDHAFYSDEYDSDEEYLEDDFFSVRSIGLGRTGHFLPNIRYNQDRAADNFDVDHFGLQSVASTGSAAVSGRGLHRILLGRSRRRRRHRIANARR